MKVQIIIFLLIIILILSTCLIIILKISLNKNYNIKIGGNIDTQINKLINKTNSLLRNNNKAYFTNILLEEKLTEILTKDFFINAKDSFRQLDSKEETTLYKYIKNLILTEIAKFINKEPDAINFAEDEDFDKHIHDIYTAIESRIPKIQTESKIQQTGTKIQQTGTKIPKKSLLRKKSNELTSSSPREKIDDIPQLITSSPPDEELIENDDELIEHAFAEIELCNEEKKLLNTEKEKLITGLKELSNTNITLKKELIQLRQDLEQKKQQMEKIEANRLFGDNILIQENTLLKSMIDRKNKLLDENGSNLNRLELEQQELASKNLRLNMDIQNNNNRQNSLYKQIYDKMEIIKNKDKQIETLLKNDSKQLDNAKNTLYTTNQHNKYLQAENKELESKIAVLKDVNFENTELLKNITILTNENEELRIELKKLNNDIDKIVDHLKTNPLIH